MACCPWWTIPALGPGEGQAGAVEWENLTLALAFLLGFVMGVVAAVIIMRVVISSSRPRP